MNPDQAKPDQASSPRSLGSLYLWLLVSAGLVVVADQVTKELALNSLSGGRAIDVIDGVLRFRLAFNPGGAFGVLRDAPGFFLVATAVVVVAILVWVRRLEDRRWIVPLGLVLGGGLGNLFDRVFRNFDGRVVDFIDLHVWPVFNLADSAIVIGVLILVWTSYAHKDPE